jgi:hypothetical protein
MCLNPCANETKFDHPNCSQQAMQRVLTTNIKISGTIFLLFPPASLLSSCYSVPSYFPCKRVVRRKMEERAVCSYIHRMVSSRGVRDELLSLPRFRHRPRHYWHHGWQYTPIRLSHRHHQHRSEAGSATQSYEREVSMKRLMAI